MPLASLSSTGRDALPAGADTAGPTPSAWPFPWSCPLPHGHLADQLDPLTRPGHPSSQGRECLTAAISVLLLPPACACLPACLPPSGALPGMCMLLPNTDFVRTPRPAHLRCLVSPAMVSVWLCGRCRVSGIVLWRCRVSWPCLSGCLHRVCHICVLVETYDFDSSIVVLIVVIIITIIITIISLITITIISNNYHYWYYHNHHYRYHYYRLHHHNHHQITVIAILIR